MRVSVDTNVFSALLSGDEHAVSTMQTALERISAEGILMVAPVVYAELVAGRSPEAVESFLSGKEIEVDWRVGREVWRMAGSRYGAYAGARRRQGRDAGPRRILADFLIGAHALHSADSFLTSDASICGTYFPELRVISPENVINGTGG